MAAIFPELSGCDGEAELRCGIACPVFWSRNTQHATRMNLTPYQTPPSPTTVSHYDGWQWQPGRQGRQKFVGHALAVDPEALPPA